MACSCHWTKSTKALSPQGPSCSIWPDSGGWGARLAVWGQAQHSSCCLCCLCPPPRPRLWALAPRADSDCGGGPGAGLDGLSGRETPAQSAHGLLLRNLRVPWAWALQLWVAQAQTQTQAAVPGASFHVSFWPSRTFQWPLFLPSWCFTLGCLG